MCKTNIGLYDYTNELKNYLENHIHEFKRIGDQDRKHLDDEIFEQFQCSFDEFQYITRVEHVDRRKYNTPKWNDVFNFLEHTSTELKEYSAFYFVRRNLKESTNEQERVSPEEINCKKFFAMKARKFERAVEEIKSKELQGIDVNFVRRLFSNETAMNNFKVIYPLVFEGGSIYDIHVFIKKNQNLLEAIDVEKDVGHISSMSSSQCDLPSTQTNAQDPSTYLPNIYNYMKELSVRNSKMEKEISSLKLAFDSHLGKLQMNQSNYSTSSNPNYSYTPYFTSSRTLECYNCKKLSETNQELISQLEEEKMKNKSLIETNEKEQKELKEKICNLESLINQKKKTEELIKKGDIMNSEGKVKLEEIKKVLISYNDKCFELMDNLGIKDESKSEIIEFYIKHSVSRAFIQTEQLDERKRYCFEFYKNIAPDVGESQNKVKEFMDRHITTIHHVMEDAPNFTLGWFDRSETYESERYSIHHRITSPNESAVYFVCMDPCINYGTKCFFKGCVCQVNPTSVHQKRKY